MVMPGDNVEFEVELITPIAMDKELRFAIREGGHTVGAGVVTDIVEQRSRLMANQTIRISLRAYDHILLDKSTEKIVKTAKSTGAIISGPIPLPTHRSIYTILRQPHVNKKSREQFQTKIHKRLVDILNSTPKTVESLMKLDLPAGVDVEIKV